MHHFVGADNSCISWGHAQNGELGYGPSGQKSMSSAVPKKVDIMEGMHVMGVACGTGHSMVIVDRMNVGDRLDQAVTIGSFGSFRVLLDILWFFRYGITGVGVQIFVCDGEGLDVYDGKASGEGMLTRGSAGSFDPATGSGCIGRTKKLMTVMALKS
ncbi:PROTEIN RCC2 [Salix purpurea]|uniref:PROTEIN RCC2 n=1 Tax=Salix purpurea TaxID=77065 RepID=A0A9Q0PAU9_SALPP|nr:PROTEIN RCC2 [Salix purpurea]